MGNQEIYLVGWNKSVSGNIVPVFCEKLNLEGSPSEKYQFSFAKYSSGTFDKVLEGVQSVIDSNCKLANEIEKKIGFYPHSMNTGKALLSDEQERLTEEKQVLFHYNNELRSAIEKIRATNGSWNKKLENEIIKFRMGEN